MGGFLPLVWYVGRYDCPILARVDLRNLKSVASPQNDHVIQTTPLSGEFFTLVVGLAVVIPLAKFKECSFIHSRNIDEGLKSLKGSRDRDHTRFEGGIFFSIAGLAIVDAFAKFKERSFIHSIHIEGGVENYKKTTPFRGEFLLLGRDLP